MIQIRYVTAHYKGMVIESPAFVGEEGNSFLRLCESECQELDQQPPHRIVQYLDFIQNSGNRVISIRDALALVAIIYWLEKRRHMQSDNENGIGWVAVDEENKRIELLRLDAVDPAQVAGTMANLLPKGIENAVQTTSRSEIEKRIMAILTQKT
jgi:hypothetical protein